MYCTKCGYNNDDGAMFCASCGSLIAQDYVSNGIQEMQSEKVSEVNNVAPVSQVQPVQTMQPNSVPQMQPVQTMQPNPVSQVQPVQSQQPETVQSQVNISKPIPNQVEDSLNEKNIVYPSIYTVASSRKANSNSKRKLSVPALVLSLIIMLATIGSVVTFFFGYAGIKLTVTYDGETEKPAKAHSAYDIIIDDSLREDMDLPDDDSADKIINSLDLYCYLIIGFVVAILIFGIIDCLLLFVQRGRMACVFAMIFALVKMAIGCGTIYIWCDDLTKQLNDLYETAFESLSIKVAVDLVPGNGLILAMVMQAVILISAIILMFVKPKYEGMPAETMAA